MAVMSGGISVRAATGGGVASAIARRALGGESFVYSSFTADIHGAWIAVAPPKPGDVEVISLSNRPMLIQSGALLAYSEGVDVSMRYGGVRSVVMQEGVVFLKASGAGDALVCSYGAIETITLGPGESLIVDTGHLVAFSEDMQYAIGPLGSVATSALTGEGIVSQFTGPGDVVIQTRAERDLQSWILPERDHNAS